LKFIQIYLKLILLNEKLSCRERKFFDEKLARKL
jgi:hypothetical protein